MQTREELIKEELRELLPNGVFVVIPYLNGKTEIERSLWEGTEYENMTQFGFWKKVESTKNSHYSNFVQGDLLKLSIDTQNQIIEALKEYVVRIDEIEEKRNGEDPFSIIL